MRAALLNPLSKEMLLSPAGEGPSASASMKLCLYKKEPPRTPCLSIKEGCLLAMRICLKKCVLWQGNSDFLLRLPTKTPPSLGDVKQFNPALLTLQQSSKARTNEP